MTNSSGGFDNTKYFDLVRKQHPVVLTPNAGSVAHYRCIDYLKRIVPREEWGAAPPVEVEGSPPRPLQHPTPFVLFTFTMTEPCYNLEDCKAACRKLQKDQMDEGYPDITFNFMIGDDLNVYEGRGWDIQPDVDWTQHDQHEDKKGRTLDIAYMGVDEVERFPALDVMHVRDALCMYGFRHNYLDIRYFRRPSLHPTWKMEILEPETEFENLEEFKNKKNKFPPKKYLVKFDEPEVPLNIYTRETWGALPPKYEKPLKTPLRIWMFIWSNTKTCKNKEECIEDMRTLQRRDMFEQGMPDIQYNFYITKDLSIYEGRGWHTASTETYKQYSEIEDEILDVCYIGRYKRKIFPSEEVLQVVMELIRYGQRQKPRLMRKYYQTLPVLTDRNWDPWRNKPLADKLPFP